MVPAKIIYLTGALVVAHLAPASPTPSCDSLLAAGLRTTHEINRAGPGQLRWAEMNENKRFVFRRLLAERGAEDSARPVTFAKYHLDVPAEDLGRAKIVARTNVTVRADVYDYAPSAAGEFRAYVNFADQNLFGYYASGLLAQDEMQVAEHPGLAYLREFALSTDPEAMHLDQGTHEVALIRDVARLGSLGGALYGQAFANASVAALEANVVKFARATFSNILAMAAKPVAARLEGLPYREDDVRFHFDTALTAFTAARAAAGARRLVVHTGNWGAGAFGNDAQLMALIQIVAAHAAGVDDLVYHTVTTERLEAVRRAEADLARFQSATQSDLSVSDYLRWMVSMRRPYGRGNGT